MKRFPSDKKGIVLAYVIIITAAMLVIVTAILFAARTSITSTDTGVKSREAYLNAKSGIEYSKILTEQITADKTAQLTASPASITSFSATEGPFYACYSADTGFQKEVSSTSTAYQNSKIQIAYEIENQITSASGSIVAPDGSIDCDYNLVIRFTSTGKSANSSALSAFASGGVTLNYQIEPLSGPVTYTPASIGNGELLVSEGTDFDADISSDMSCYYRGDGSTTGTLFGYNSGSTYAAKHSIVYTNPILGLSTVSTTLTQKANKMYFLGAPSVDVSQSGYNSNLTVALTSNYIYFGSDITISNIVYRAVNNNATFSFGLIPLTGGGNCVVFFDDITVTVSYYDKTNTLITQTQTLNGYYNFTAASNYLFKVTTHGSGGGRYALFTWAPFSSLKITDPVAIDAVKNHFDPYLTKSSLLGITADHSGRFKSWTADSGSLSTTNATTFTTSLSFLSPPASDNSKDLLLVYANTLTSLATSSSTAYTAKQIRLTASMKDSAPAGIAFSSAKTITFNTDLFSYYGGTITKSGSCSMILKSLSGDAYVTVYFGAATKIGTFTFPAGYSQVPSDTDLLGNSVSRVDYTPNIYASGVAVPESGSFTPATIEAMRGIYK